MPRVHHLFEQYPLQGPATISTGEVPTPYHVYDGHEVLIGGSVDLAAVRQLLSHETVTPIQTCDGRTAMAIWVCNFTDASLGPHHELQFSFFVSRGRVGPVACHPLSLLGLMTRPDVQMMCHGLWNNTPTVVAYNRELLSLNARLAQSQIDNGVDIFDFNFREQASGRAILAGRLADLQKVSFRANWDLMAHLGFRRVWRLSRQPWLGLQILNPTGILLTRNAVAETFTKNDINLVRHFNELTDNLEFGDTPYSRLDFNPQFAQYMKGFKFVYLPPN